MARREGFDDLFEWLSRTLEIKKTWTALDFGCGRNGHGLFYRDHVARMVGLYINDHSEFYRDMEFVLSDGKNIPLEDETFDLIVSHSVLEHVGDLHHSVREIDRVLKVGGYAYLTVSPLYYFASGSHVSSPRELSNWEHLDPNSPYYLVEHPNGPGSYVNKLTYAKMLEAIGHVAWDILRSEVRTDRKVAPDWVDQTKFSPVDIYTREFRLLAHRRTRIGPTGALRVRPHPFIRAPKSRGARKTQDDGDSNAAEEILGVLSAAPSPAAQ